MNNVTKNIPFLFLFLFLTLSGCGNQSINSNKETNVPEIYTEFSETYNGEVKVMDCLLYTSIIKVRNFAVTRSFLVIGITNAYLSHLEILSKEKVVIIIILHSRQQVT